LLEVSLYFFRACLGGCSDRYADCYATAQVLCQRRREITASIRANSSGHGAAGTQDRNVFKQCARRARGHWEQVRGKLLPGRHFYFIPPQPLCGQPQFRLTKSSGRTGASSADRLMIAQRESLSRVSRPGKNCTGLVFVWVPADASHGQPEKRAGPVGR